MDNRGGLYCLAELARAQRVVDSDYITMQESVRGKQVYGNECKGKPETVALAHVVSMHEWFVSDLMLQATGYASSG